MKKSWHLIFNGDCGDTRIDVIRWWEQRRLDFNAYVGVVGVISWLLVLIAGGAAVKPGVDFEEPIAMIEEPVFYAIMANVCYTFGWIVDLVAFSGAPRKKLFRLGLIFSLIVTALPGLWAVSAFLMTVYTGRKLE
jgi:hypothetical protein